MEIVYNKPIDMKDKKCRACGEPAKWRIKAEDCSGSYWYYCTKCKEETTM